MRWVNGAVGRESAAGVRFSVLLYTHAVDGAGVAGQYGGALSWRKSVAPVCAARLDMCTCGVATNFVKILVSGSVYGKGLTGGCVAGVQLVEE